MLSTRCFVFLEWENELPTDGTRKDIVGVVRRCYLLPLGKHGVFLPGTTMWAKAIMLEKRRGKWKT